MDDQIEEPIPVESDDLQDQMIIKVDKNQTPTRIDSFLNDRIKNVSRTRIQHGLRSGAITVDGKAVKPNFKVLPQQLIQVIVPHHGNYEIVPEDIPLDIIYEDDDLMIVNKPAGMVVHPGVGNYNGTLLNALAHYLKLDTQKNKDTNTFNYERLGLVHRIDKETSGLLVIAKNDFALSHLAKQFYNHTSSREYVALVWGELNEDIGTIDMHIGRHARHRQLFTVYPDGDHGKHAITHWQTLEKLYYVSLVKCTLETGRTHQIRVHMQSLGHPIFNDERYGGDRIVKGTVHAKYKQFVDNLFTLFRRHALHAKTLGVNHPTTGIRMEFTSPLPPEFDEMLTKWRNYVTHQKQLKL